MADLTRVQIVAMLKDGKTQFSDMDLSGLDLSGLDLSGCSFHGTNLEKCNLKGITGDKINMSWAKLTDADIDNAVLTDVNLYKTEKDYAAKIAPTIIEDKTIEDSQIVKPITITDKK